MITNAELVKIAQLARLSLSGEDTDALAADMADIMAVANSIDEVDLSGCDCTADGELAEPREDCTEPSLPVEAILQNAGEKRDGYFAGRIIGVRKE